MFGDNKKRDVPVIVLFTTDEKKLLRRFAKTRGYTISSYVRNLIKKDMGFKDEKIKI